MKEIKTIVKAANVSAVDFGKLSELDEYILSLGPDIQIPGKVFGGSAVATTGADFSLQAFAPGTETGFVHTHKNHEELYFFLSGNGEFQVDGQAFKVKEGSVVKVAPQGKRSVRNNGTQPLIMLCVQYRANTFTPDDANDADILQEKVLW